MILAFLLFIIMIDTLCLLLMHSRELLLLLPRSPKRSRNAPIALFEA